MQQLLWESARKSVRNESEREKSPSSSFAVRAFPPLSDLFLKVTGGLQNTLGPSVKEATECV